MTQKKQKFMNGGMNEGTICIPKQLKDLAIIFIYPPLYIFIQEYKSEQFKMMNVIICFLLTCFFYFPGVLYAMKRLRDSDLTASRKYFNK